MRIAITLNTSWNIYNFRLGLIIALQKEGHKVFAIAPEDAYSEKLVAAGCQFVPIKLDNTGSNPIKDLSLYFQLKKIYQKLNLDIIYHYTVKPNIYGTLAAHACGIPVINNVSGLGTVFLASNFTAKIAKWLYKVSFDKATLVLFQNVDDRAEFLSQINLPYLKTDLLPGSGIDLTRFKPTPFQSKGKMVFLMIARLIIEKGVIEYLEAAKEIKKQYNQVEFQLLGKMETSHVRGVSKALIDGYIEEGIITYLGELEDVRPAIESAHCVVLPSYREGTPRTMLEAGAMARPVITTDVPGCREVVIDGESGFLCKAMDTEDLALKMKFICDKSYEELSEMGNAGRELIERKYDQRIVIDKYLEHTRDIINQLPSQ